MKPPVLPSSLFAFLEEQQTETVMVKGREARMVPHLAGPTFVTTTELHRCRVCASRLNQRSVALGAVCGDIGCLPSHRRWSSGPLLLLPPTFNSPVAQSESLHHCRAATLH